MSNFTMSVSIFAVLFIVLSVIIKTQSAAIELDSQEREFLEQVSPEILSPEQDWDETESVVEEEEEEESTAAGLGAQYPPATVLNAANPLRDQPNLSTGRISATDQIIYGSRKAFTVTKVEYLKKEWCKTEPLKQVIREEGCLQRTVVNRFCYGQCNSFFIPKSNKKDLEAAAFKSCSFCKPKRYSWITVTLRCPRRKPRFKRKRIQMIKQCKCMAQKLD